MAESLDDGEFWLPPQFLTDDDTPINDNKNSNSNNNNLKAKNDDAFYASLRDLFPCEFPYGLSSPVESVVGSSETESSDEEEHMAELTRRMTHQLDLNRSENSKGTVVSGGSPKSPNSVCQMNSQSNATWDLLHAAAGEVKKMRVSVPLPVTQTKPGVGFYTQQSLSHLQLQQIAQFRMLREQQMVKQQQGMVWGYQQRQQSNYSSQMGGNRGRNSDVVGGRKIGAKNMVLSTSAWPHAQQVKQQQYEYVCDMRGVFSGKRESTGTGVFLPRCVVDYPAESRKKTASSTVLDLKQQRQTRCNETLNLDYASDFPRIQSNYGISQQKRNIRPPPPVNHEIRLPQEWTY